MFKGLSDKEKDAKKTIDIYAPRISCLLNSADRFASYCTLSLLARTFNSNSSDFHGLMEDVLKDPNKEQKLKQLDEVEGPWLTRFANEFCSTRF